MLPTCVAHTIPHLLARLLTANFGNVSCACFYICIMTILCVFCGTAVAFGSTTSGLVRLLILIPRVSLIFQHFLIYLVGFNMAGFFVFIDQLLTIFFNFGVNLTLC